MNYLEEKRKTIINELDYRLPKGYTPVEYIESTSHKQWFDSGIKGSYKTRLLGEWWFDANTIGNEYIWLFQGENAIVRYSLGLGRLKGDSWEFSSGSAKNNFTEPAEAKCRFVADVTPQKCIINGVTRSTHDPNNFTSNRNIFLFGTSSSTRIRADKGDDGQKRIYWLKIWDGQTLVRDFQPCLDSSRRPCLYDRVSAQNFYNKGSLEFDYKLL